MYRRIPAGRGRFRPLTSLFALLYLFFSVLAAAHTHEAGATRNVASGPAVSVSHGGPFLTAEHTRSAADCPICAFLAHLVSPEPTPPVVTQPIAAIEIPAPPIRPQPYLPYRFCDRSSSRAPPALLYQA
jgi:hypothetical protein